MVTLIATLRVAIHSNTQSAAAGCTKGLESYLLKKNQTMSRRIMNCTLINNCVRLMHI